MFDTDVDKELKKAYAQIMKESFDAKDLGEEVRIVGIEKAYLKNEIEKLDKVGQDIIKAFLAQLPNSKDMNILGKKCTVLFIDTETMTDYMNLSNFKLSKYDKKDLKKYGEVLDDSTTLDDIIGGMDFDCIYNLLGKLTKDHTNSFEIKF